MSSDSATSTATTSPSPSSTGTPSNDYDYDYLGPTDSYANLQCPICHSPFVDPWMSVACEHFYCYTCILEHLSSNSTCPCDRLPLRLCSTAGPATRPEDLRPTTATTPTSTSNYIVPAPRLIKLLCDELEVQCTRCSDWKGQRAHWHQHSLSCSSRPERTTDSADDACRHGCGAAAWERGDTALRERHEESECPNRPVVCALCDASVSASEWENHERECPSSVTNCPHCGEFNDVTNAQLREHLANACPKAEVRCTHERFGCTWTGTRQDLVERHLPCACPYESLKTFIGNNEQQIMQLQRENTELRGSIRSLRTLYDQLSSRVDRLTTRLGPSPENASTHADPMSTMADHHDEGPSITENIAHLTTQLSALTASSDAARQSTEQSILGLRGEFGNLQMALHDLRGEMMSLQQMHYLENASRFAYRLRDTNATTTNATSSGSELKGDKEDRPQLDGQSSSLPSLAYPAFPPHSTMVGYPFPPLFGPASLPPQQTPYSPPSMRRMYGWPPYTYPPYGATNPYGPMHPPEPSSNGSQMGGTKL